MNIHSIILIILLTHSIAFGQKKTLCEGFAYINDDSLRSKKIIDINYIYNNIVFKTEPEYLSSILSNNNALNRYNIDSFLFFYDTVSYTYNENGLINVIEKHNIFRKSVKYHLYTQIGQLKSTIEYVNNYNFKKSKHLNYNQINNEIYDYDINNKLIRKHLYTNPYDTVLSLRSTNKYTYKKNKLITDTMVTYDILELPHSKIDAIFINQYTYSYNNTKIKEYLHNGHRLTLMSKSDSGIVSNNKNGLLYCKKEDFFTKSKEIHYYSPDGLLQKSIFYGRSDNKYNYKLTINYKYTNY